MRLLIIYHGGAAQNARAIYRILARAGEIELTVIVPQKLKVDRIYDPSGWLSAENEQNDNGYRLMAVPLRNPQNYGDGFVTEPLRRLIRQTQPELIHVLDELTSGYLYQVVWQRLLALTRPGVLFYGFENLISRLGWRGRLKWQPTWAQMAGGVVASSEALENVRRAGFPRKRPLERIFWGIPTDVFQPMDRQRLKEELGLEGEHIVGFVGRLVPEKGVLVLLAAMRRLPKEVHCLLVGDGLLRAELELWAALPELRNRIHLRSAMEPEHLVKYLNCLDVLTLPSLTTTHWKEQYGRVLGEAMACGVPVVGSDSGAIPEVMGPAGLIVTEGNTVALADSLRTVIFNVEARQRLAEAGLQRAHRELSVQVMAERLLDFYRRI